MMKKKTVGRPTGWKPKVKKKQDTICLRQDDWDILDEIGPSRGRAVKKLIDGCSDDVK